MSTAITVREVSKRYRIGLAEERSETFAGQIMDMVKAPLRNLKQLRSLSRFKEEDESVFWALRDISFDVQEGEVLGIIGHNGAGKSTLLKILSRITEPTTGEITIKGRVSSLLEVGTGFHPDLTGRENIYMNGTILGMRKKEIDRKLDEIIAFSGVTKYIDTPVKRYSSGMKVRLAFSVAAHLEPEVLIIDEVLAVGDAEFQAKCLGKMEDVAGQGKTVLFVSHNMAAVSNLCTQGIVLNKGEVSFSGNISDTIDNYRRNIFRQIDQDLNIRDDREGGGDFSFTRILINDGAPILPKQNLSFLLTYKSKLEVKDLQVAIKISNEFNEKLLVIDNKTQGVKLFLEAGEGHINIIVPDFRLMANRYVVDLWAGSERGVEDKIFNVTELVVEESDIYETGIKLNHQKNGLVIVDKCNWNIKVN